LGAACAVVLISASIAALLPVRFDSREELFEVPKGTWARRRSGDDLDILPERIRLLVGLRDILVLRNLDEVPQIFGPTLIMPGQTFRLPFELPSEYQFACTAHVSGQMTVVVEEAPSSPWQRLHWRTGELLRSAPWL
jgi:hypothetical protein